MLARVAAFTVNVAVPDNPPKVAVMVEAPTSTAVAKPRVPAAVLMVALAVLLEVQVALEVMSWVVLSE